MTPITAHPAASAATPPVRFWPAAAAAITVAVALHLIVTRPMMRRVETLSLEVTAARAELAAVAGSKSDAWRTNDLLTALTVQAERVAAAETALAGIDAMTGDLEILEARIAAVAAKTGEAMAVVARFETLHDRIVAAAGDAAGIDRDLDDIREVTDRIDELAYVAPLHEQTLDDIHVRVSELSAMANDLIVHEDVIRRAGRRVDAVVAMSDCLATTDTAAAAAASQQLVDVARQLADEGTQVVEPAAQAMTAMRAATAGLDEQSARLATMVQTSEVIHDFEAEMAAHIRGLDDIRREMVDFAMLRPAMDRVVSMLRPLTDVARLDRVDAEDLRRVVDAMAPAGDVTQPPAPRWAGPTVPDPTPVLR